MKTMTGTVNDVEQNQGSNGPYLTVTLDGTYFSCFNGELFETLKTNQGQQVTLEYEENNKDGKTFRNIQGVPSHNGGGQSGGSQGGAPQGGGPPNNPPQSNKPAGTGYTPQSSGGASNSDSTSGGMTDREIRAEALACAVDFYSGSGELQKVKPAAEKFADYIKNGRS